MKGDLVMMRTMAVLGVVLVAATPVWATVLSGPGGSGVPVGSSDLIHELDLSDTFTGTADGSSNPNRPYIPAIQPAPAYVLEDTHGNVGRSWTSSFSFASDRNPTNPGFVDGSPPFPGSPLVNENVSGAGTITGFTQTGGAVDYGVPYSLRNRFVAQFDAVQNTDRVDITSNSGVGGIASGTGLSVFFRQTGGVGPWGEIGLYRAGVGETNTGLTSGISTTTAWNNYAVAFDRVNNTIEVFVNEVSRGTVDLNTFAGGAYANFATTAVNFGGAGGNRVWTDNAQIGAMEPALPLPTSLISYWSFDESSSGTGTVWDQAHANNGAFAGTATRAPGLIGAGAAQFNHTGGDAVNVGNGQNGVNNLFSVGAGLTVEALILPDRTLGTNRYEEIFRKEDGGNRILLSFQEYGGILSFGINDGTGYKELDMPLDGSAGVTLADLLDGEMHHIAAAYDSASGFKGIYVDALLRYSGTFGAGVDMISGGGGAAMIGNYTANNEPFAGIIDEVAIYDTALSASVLRQHYDNVRAGRSYFDDAIPEPATLALLGLGIAALARRRRK